MGIIALQQNAIHTSRYAKSVALEHEERLSNHRFPMTLQDGIPIPPKDQQRGYPWKTMGLKQSFLIPCTRFERRRVWSSVKSCIYNAQRKTGRKFEARWMKAEAGIRVWRVA